MMQKPAKNSPPKNDSPKNDSQKNDSGAKRNPNEKGLGEKRLGEKGPREKGLGRGLKALLGDGTAPNAATDRIIAIEHIEPNPWQPRRNFPEAELAELAASLKQHGMIQPLLVRPHPTKPDYFQLIAGERRWRAAQLAKQHQTPIIIRNATDSESAEIALIENMQRQDLNAIEEADGYQRLMDEFKYKQEELAKIIGKSRSYIANALRLLRLPQKVQTMLANGTLTIGQARPLIGHENATQLAETIQKQKLNARQAEQLTTKKPKKHPPENANLKAITAQVENALGLDVRLQFNDKTERGKVVLNTTSLEQFDELIHRLCWKQHS